MTGIYPLGTTCSTKGSATAVYSAAYDPWGNQTTRTTGGVTGTLSYDQSNRMTEWNAGANSQEFYLYDATGNRILKRSITGTGTTLAVYSFGLEENDYTGTGVLNTQTHYYNLAGHLIGSSNGTTTTFYMTDALDSVLTAFGQSAIEGEQVYGPFGASSYQSGLINTAKGYTGQVHDGVSGLDYYVARYYDPVIGMFLSADMVQGNLQGMDPYAYVGNSPETRIDPTGHAWDDPWLVYVGAFYTLIHPDDYVEIDNPFNRGLVIPGGSQSGSGNDGYADIANISENIIWDAKTGGGTGYAMGNFMPADSTVAAGAVQAQDYVNKLNDPDGGGWRTGSVNPNNPPSRNDRELQIALDLCGGQCQFSFTDGLQMLLKVPMDGVIAYSVTRRPNGGFAALTTAVLSLVWGKRGRWSPVDFALEVEAVYRAGPAFLAIFLAAVAKGVATLPLPFTFNGGQQPAYAYGGTGNGDAGSGGGGGGPGVLGGSDPKDE